MHGNPVVATASPYCHPFWRHVLDVRAVGARWTNLVITTSGTKDFRTNHDLMHGLKQVKSTLEELALTSLEEVIVNSR